MPSSYLLLIILVPLVFALWYKTKSLAIVIPLLILCAYLWIKIRLNGMNNMNKQITPAMLWKMKQMAKSNPNGYKRLLRKRITCYEAMLIECKEKNINSKQVWIDNLRLLKKELSEVEQKLKSAIIK